MIGLEKLYVRWADLKHTPQAQPVELFCLPEMPCFVILVAQKSDFKGAGLDVCTSERRTHTS